MPDPSELTAKSSAVMRIAWTRPARSATRPPRSAPTAEPRSAEAIANPSRLGSAWKCRSSAPTVPLTTAVSYPNRKPPSAATPEMKRT